MVWGFAIPSKIFQPILEGILSYDFHEHLSLLGLGLVILHVVVLMFDKFLPVQHYPDPDSLYRYLPAALGGSRNYQLLPAAACHIHVLSSPADWSAGIPFHPSPEPGRVPGCDDARAVCQAPTLRCLWPSFCMQETFLVVVFFIGVLADHAGLWEGNPRNGQDPANNGQISAKETATNQIAVLHKPDIDFDLDNNKQETKVSCLLLIRMIRIAAVFKK